MKPTLNAKATASGCEPPQPLGATTEATVIYTIVATANMRDLKVLSYVRGLSHIGTYHMMHTAGRAKCDQNMTDRGSSGS